MDRVFALLRREPLAVLLVPVVLGLALVPRNAVASVELTAALIAPLLFLALIGRSHSRPSKATVAVVVLACVAAVALLVGALLADTPLVSLFGNRGQHSGAATWLALASVIAVWTLAPERGRLLPAARAVSVVASVLALAAVAERFGILGAIRLSDSPSGLMENSISLAQVLVLGIGASVLWATRATETVGRILAIVCAAIAGAGLLLSNTRAAVLGIAIAAVIVAAAWAWARIRSLSSYWLAGLMTGAAALVLAAAWWFVTSAPIALWQRADGLLSGRITIWLAAAIKATRALAFGFGPEQFSAWATWGVSPEGALTYVGTYDPHNLLLFWLLAAGIPGLLLALGGTFLVLERLWRAVIASRFHLGLATLVGALIAWGVTLMFAWTGVLAALCAAVLVACIISELDGAAAGSHADGAAGFVPLAASAVLAIACAALLVVSLPVTAGERAWAAGLQQRTLTPELLMQIAEATGDPIYAADARVLLQAAGTADDNAMQAVVIVVEPAAQWSVDSALSWNSIEFRRARDGEDQEAWNRAVDAFDDGRLADPATALWDYAQAIEASVLGKDAEAAAAAEAALQGSVGDRARAQLEELAQ